MSKKNGGGKERKITNKNVGNDDYADEKRKYFTTN